jgi:hypothetical protein
MELRLGTCAKAAGKSQGVSTTEGHPIFILAFVFELM